MFRDVVRFHHLRTHAVCAVLALVGCKNHEAEPAKTDGTWYRAHLDFDELGELPFFLQLPPVGQAGAAHVVNGEERAEFQATWHANKVTVIGPWNYTSVIEAQDLPTGLTGTWTRYTPMWGTVVRKFAATPIDAPDPGRRFPPGPAPLVSAAGIWHFQFEAHNEGKGVLEQNSDGVVRGYIKPGELGDIRFLAGNMRGSHLYLSSFNGNVANLVLANMSSDGRQMSGLVSLQNVWNERFTARKGEDFEIVNRVHLAEGKQTVTLQGLDTYRGKPTLAVIFATWCSSCNDLAPYLVDLYASYHRRGLEILGVAYDLNPDEKENVAELDIFRSKYKIPWELLQVPCTPETWQASMPPELEDWDGLPILLLVRPDGTIRSVFGGWFGPATGADGEKRRKVFELAIDALVTGSKTTN